MKLLVTGATGFIGRSLTADLVARGDEVHVLSRDPARASEQLPGIAAAHGQESDGAVPPALASGLDGVVNLAGESVAGRWTERKRQAIRTSRTQGTARLVASLRAAGAKPRIFVSASAIGYYGDRGEAELDESAAPGDDFLAQVCREWEASAAAARDLGARVVCLRFGVVLGRGGGALEPMERMFRLGLGGPVGSGRQWWSWIHLADAVALVLAALDGRFEGPVNATAPHPVRQAEFARTLGRALGRPAVLPAPAFAIRLAAGGFADELLASRRVFPRAALSTGFTFRFETLEAAFDDLL